LEGVFTALKKEGLIFDSEVVCIPDRPNPDVGASRMMFYVTFHGSNRLHPGVEPPDWVHLSNRLDRVTRNAIIGDRDVRLDIHVDADCIEVTGFDITTDEPRWELVGLGVLQSIRQRAERADFTVVRLIVLSSNSEMVEPLLDREGYTIYRPRTENTPHEIVGVLQNL